LIDPSSDSPSSAPLSHEHRAWLATLALAGIAAWLRWTGLAYGAAADELNMTQTGPLSELLRDPKGGVNPPLIRAAFSALFPPAEAIAWGRRWSLFCGTLAVPLAYLAGRAAARGAGLARWSGLLLAALVTFHQQAIQQSAMLGTYATWLALTLWHLRAACALAARSAGSSEQPGQNRLRLQLALSALLMAQTHYFSAPILLLEGLALASLADGRRAALKALALYAPAALGLLPLAPLILGGAAPHQAPAEGALAYGLSQAMGAGQGPLFTALGAAAFLGGWWAWPRLTAPLKVVMGGAAGLLAGVMVFGSVHYLTPWVAIFGLPFFGTLASCLPALVPESMPPRIAWAAAALWPLQGLARTQEPEAVTLYEEARVAWEAGALAGEPEVVVYPEHLVPVLFFHATGQLYEDATPPASCRGFERCFVWEGARFTGGGWRDDEPRPTLVVWFEAPEETPDGCERLPDVEPARFRCEQ